jgi:hypothetical protein
MEICSGVRRTLTTSDLEGCSRVFHGGDVGKLKEALLSGQSKLDEWIPRADLVPTSLLPFWRVAKEGRVRFEFHNSLARAIDEIDGPKLRDGRFRAVEFWLVARFCFASSLPSSFPRLVLFCTSSLRAFVERREDS